MGPLASIGFLRGGKLFNTPARGVILKNPWYDRTVITKGSGH
jgi:hypothetical protein